MVTASPSLLGSGLSADRGRLAQRLRTETDAYQVLEWWRWSGRPRSCPHCGATRRFYFLSPRSGDLRQTRTGVATHRRLWKCGTCRRQFSALHGTVLQRTKIPLRTWLLAVCDSVEGEPLTLWQAMRRYKLGVEGGRTLLERLPVFVQQLQQEAAARTGGYSAGRSCSW
jgi:transposase-like protein